MISLTMRAVLACVTAYGFSVVGARVFIQWLKTKQLGQPIRQEGPQSHYSKSGTPTMGGAFLLLAAAASTVLWMQWQSSLVWVALLTLLSFGWIGWIDDYRKVIQKHTGGLPGRWKYFWQSVLACLILGYLYWAAPSVVQTTLWIPFLKTTCVLGTSFWFLGYFAIVGASNAVNLTDGLDGLAVVPTLLVLVGLSICAVISGHVDWALAFGMPYVPGASELLIFCAALVGAGLGFLWFNAFPALVFMGDVGSLALGATLGVLAVMLRQEGTLVIMSFVFVLETLSVILQVSSYKLRNKKRLFKMAPIHHHFELEGCPEPRIVVRFWIVTFFCILLGLSGTGLGA